MKFEDQEKLFPEDVTYARQPLFRKHYYIVESVSKEKEGVQKSAVMIKSMYFRKCVIKIKAIDD
jgi:hypothetical protein